MADNSLDGVGRRLRPPGSEQANAEELLAELVRLVESSGITPERSRQPAGTVSDPNRTDTQPMQPLEMTSLRPSVEAPSRKPSETRVVDVEPQRAPESDNSYSNDPNGADLATRRRAGTGKFTVSALMLVGVAALGSIVWLKRAEPGVSNAPPVMATMQEPATTQPRSNLTVATSSEAGATLKDIPQPAQGKGASPEDRPVDLNARVSLNNPPQLDLAQKPVGAAQPIADAPATAPPAASVNTSAVAAPVAAPQPVASQSLDPKPAPAVSLPPDSTQIATPTPSIADSGAAVRPTNAPLPPVRPAAKAVTEPAGVGQRSMSKLELPTKLSSKSEARVVVAKAEATGPSERSEPQHEGLAKPEKGAKTPKVAPAPVEAQAAPSAPPAAPPKQPNTNPVVHAFNNVVGAVVGFIPFIPH